MNLTLEQVRERDRTVDRELRAIVRAFVETTGYDLNAIAFAGRLYPRVLPAAMCPGAYITELVYVRIVNALVWLSERGVIRDGI